MSQRHLPPVPATRPSSLSRRTLLAAAAAAVPAGATVLAAAPALADPAVTDGETRIVDVPLAGVPLVEAGGAEVRDLARQPATMVGVTWPADVDAPVVHARGLDAAGSWSGWVLLETAEDPQTGEDAAGTEAGWIGVVSALQIRAELDGADVTASLVAHVVTTSPAPADVKVPQLTGQTATISQSTQVTTMATASSTNPSTPVLGPGAPAYVSRAAWGADESRVRGTSGADELKAVVIHHTAGSNSYTSSQSAQVVRGILNYHTGALGWADIGYNVLVSKYGQIFEGRSGGLHRNIIGAHAYGFNTGSFGISVMGDYSSTAAPWAARQAVAELVGWKLLSTFQDDVRDESSWTPGTGTRFTAGRSVSLAKMMGHRDVNLTECPGWSLYSQFDGIRDRAQEQIDRSPKDHLRAFQAAGGAPALGTVVRSNHRTGPYWATQLTDGLVLQEDGGATAHATPFGTQWRASWGRPTRGSSQDGERRIQPFQNGTAALEDGRTRFVTPSFRDVAPSRVFFLEIQDLFAHGITNGWGTGRDRTFQPDSNNLRDAMIVFLHRAMGAPAFTGPRTSPFADVDPGFVFYDEICWAYEVGITQGWGTGAHRTFRPLEPVRRDAVAAFLYRAAGSPAASAAGADRFTDVPRDHVFAKEIGWLASTGISRGWADGTFRPNAFIKRDQMATFVMRWMAHTGRA